MFRFIARIRQTLESFDQNGHIRADFSGDVGIILADIGYEGNAANKDSVIPI